ncbi:hypothetical protein [Mammaliicoccus sciuri]|uniref:hypothetical protein n=1 Tax=Mammaliicoccus sciuri TaxID=1296 RepID=UPI000E68BDBC|nr:hypothetical protein [Mammaliicoccus sciuri]RIN99046.1 hypothetical protein BU000_04120 [Mammaliicoccus sciuri]
MPTIKTKKEMNLPHLIEWAWKNEFISSVFWTSNREEGFNNKAFFDVDGNFYTSDNFNFNDTFIVEIEEPITEDTEIPKLYMRHNNDQIDECYGMSISKFDKSRVKAFYVPNDDLTMALIWTKEKGLVE